MKTNLLTGKFVNEDGTPVPTPLTANEAFPTTNPQTQTQPKRNNDLPSYFENGLILPCYYFPDHDYYLAWHKDAGLRVISGRYAEKQLTTYEAKVGGKVVSILPSKDVSQNYKPIHLVVRRELVKKPISTNLVAGSEAYTMVWSVTEVMESEFKEILKAKPDYKTILQTFNGSENYQHQTDYYGYRIILDLKKITRVW